MMPIARAIAGAAFGAAAMYWLDPVSGHRRRAQARDRLRSAVSDLDDTAGITARDLSHRVRGLGARIRSRFASGDAPDEVLAERVRAALGRVVSHAGAIDVSVANGRVTLHGAVLTAEHAALISAVRSVRGVGEVRDELATYDHSEGVPALQGGRRHARPRSALFRENVPPAVRLVTGASGSTLVFFGARQLFGPRKHRALGALAFAAGSFLVMSGSMAALTRRLAGTSGRHGVELRKTSRAQAPSTHVPVLEPAPYEEAASQPAPVSPGQAAPASGTRTTAHRR